MFTPINKQGKPCTMCEAYKDWGISDLCPEHKNMRDQAHLDAAFDSYEDCDRFFAPDYSVMMHDQIINSDSWRSDNY